MVLDVGTGAGLIAFGALELVGSSGTVIFSDVSEELLEHCRELARERDAESRCRFVLAPAEDLSVIPPRSVDVVTARSVLIYVRAKARALREFHRVLRPGGRVSILEPINSYFRHEPGEWLGYDTGPIRDLMRKMETAYHWSEDDPGPMMGFGDRDLVRFAEEAGFRRVHLELDVSVEPGTWVRSWNVLLESSGNPLDPTFGEAMARTLTRDEARRVEEHLRPLVDSGRGTKRAALAYVRASK